MLNVVSPAITFPIASEGVTITITPASRYGQAFDIARFVTDIRLAQPLPAPQKFLIPKLDALNNGKITLQDGQEMSFDPVDAGALEKLKQQIITESNDFVEKVSKENAQQVKDLLDQVLSLELVATTEEIPANTQLIRFAYTKAIKPQNQPDGKQLYELESLVPLASFTAQQGSRLQITVVMPFDPSPSQVSGTWETPQGATGQLVPAAVEGGRTILSAFWQNDPIMNIKYQY